jgi:hypothetical protein
VSDDAFPAHSSLKEPPVKFTVEKLGPIAHAELDIRPLTVFVGHNNTGKSWTAYALYGLLRRLSPTTLWVRDDWSRQPGSLPDPQIAQTIDKAAARVGALIESAAEDEAIHVGYRRHDLLAGVTQAVRYDLSMEELRDVLKLSEEHLSRAHASLEVEPTSFTPLPVDTTIQFSVQKKLRVLSVGLHRADKKPGFTANVGISGPWDDAIRAWLEFLLRPFWGQVLAFPAERKALASMYKLLQREFENVMMLPVVDFAQFLQRAELLADKETGQFPSAITAMEQHVLRGQIGFQPAAVGMHLTYSKDGWSFPMHAVSSTIRALSGLAVYLRHFAQEGDFLVIDEPEMSGHPAQQLALTELLTLLVQKGVRIILTTHSPYIVDHINNLLEAAELPDAEQEQAASLFKLGTREAFLPVDKVAVYEFDDEGQVRPLLDRKDRVIEWATFSRETDWVSNLYSRLLSLAQAGSERGS